MFVHVCVLCEHAVFLANTTDGSHTIEMNGHCFTINILQGFGGERVLFRNSKIKQISSTVVQKSQIALSTAQVIATKTIDREKQRISNKISK